MIHFEGTETILVPATELHAKLANAGWLAQALPDAEVSEGAADHAAWRVKPKFAFMTGHLDTTAEVTQRTENSVNYTVISKGVGSSSTVVAVLQVAPAETGSTVTWIADVTELGGLLKMVPRGLIQATATKVIADVWASIAIKAKG